MQTLVDRVAKALGDAQKLAQSIVPTAISSLLLRGNPQRALKVL